MPSRRVLKAAAAVREVVSMAILTDLNDPRVEHVTVTRVEMAPDMRQAKVHVSIMGDETKQRLGLAGLKSAAGYLQSKVAKGIDTRYTPKLEFVLDQGVKRSIQIAEILGRVLTKDPAETPADDGLSGDEPPDGLPADADDFSDDALSEDEHE